MKKPHYFYHVVTGKPMHLEQIIRFDEQNKNAVFNRSMNSDFKNKNSMDAFEIIQNKFINKKLSLDEEDSEIVSEYLKWSIRGIREFILEVERQKLKPQAPSRMACLYVTKTLEDAQKWADYFIELGRPTFQIVKVSVIGNTFCGNAHHIKTKATSLHNQVKLAQAYWNNDPLKKELEETIVNGEIEVVEIVKTFRKE